ncbi:MAG TPA: metallophosphoesterase [Polyangiaceae bacterium]|nr:metallophosphoesterase [Polyangiaceae bacterium]
MPRTLFIGDVHSCADELEELLDRAALGSGDAVYFTGDLLSRGPKPHQVLKLFRKLGAQAPVGNHEQRLLDAHRARQKGEKGPKLSASHQALVDELEPEDWQVLEAMPLLVDVPRHGIVIAHAGIDPRLPLTAQDPWLVTHIRSIDVDGEPSEKWGVPWGVRYQGPPHIVFGHNARKLPQLHPFATGLDTGCVYGGRLTGMLLPQGAEPPPVVDRGDCLISVAARDEYADYGRGLPD